MAREIGQEHERALEHADEVHAVGMIAADLLRQRVHALLNVVGGDRGRSIATVNVTYVARMKRFQMITEADARVLEYGSTVMLVARRARHAARARTR